MEHQRLLGEYRDPASRRRVVVASSSPTTGILVIDRDLPSALDVRLLARLAPDEPPGNADILCADYLSRIAAGEDCTCRRITARDLAGALELDTDATGSGPHDAGHPGDPCDGSDGDLEDECGHRYALRPVALAGTPQLRWCRHERPARERLSSTSSPLSLRDVVGTLERYDPLLALTSHALSGAARGAAISTSVLRAELTRVLESPIVLNRRLREAVTTAVARGELSMSQIAMRCGRMKRDTRGNLSGETSWLARRLGLLPEGGHARPTPWIHTDVLALIARSGLGVAPREVEL